MDDWIFGLNPPFGERVMTLKPRTLQEAISIMGELDIAHQFCRRDGRGQGSQNQGSQSVAGNQKGKGKKQKGSGGASGSGGGNKQAAQSQKSSGNKGNQPGNGDRGKGHGQVQDPVLLLSRIWTQKIRMSQVCQGSKGQDRNLASAARCSLSSGIPGCCSARSTAG